MVCEGYRSEYLSVYHLTSLKNVPGTVWLDVLYESW